MKQVQSAFSKVDTKEVKNKVKQATDFVKKKVQELRQDSKNNELTVKVNNKDAQKQISQIQKQIDSLQEKINARQMKLNVINPQIDKIVDDTRKSVTPEGINTNDKAMDTTVNNALGNNKDFTLLNNQAQKLYSEIEMYNKQLSEAKNKMTQLNQETNKTATTQNKLSSFFDTFKQKIEQVKPSISNIKNSFKGLPKITQNITNNIKGMGTSVKSGLVHILKYAGALFSIREIYSILSSCTQNWLSSQNAGAKQLSANIEYMKYAMGSVFAPVIEYVTNLIYNLMKAVQSLVYAFSGVNIFAKATASSMKSASGSAKQTSKSLSSVHSEINNVSDNQNSGSSSSTPNIDLSKIENTSSSIIDTIKDGNWYEVGVTIGQKLNDAMNSIPWDKIQGTAKKIGKGIAETLNGFIATTNWNNVGNTFAQGINTVIYFGYNFVTTFDWKQFGTAIGDGINSFFNNIDWSVAGQTLSEGLKGCLNTAFNAGMQIDWEDLAHNFEEFISNIDWSEIINMFFKNVGAGFGAATSFLGTLIADIFSGIGSYFNDEIEECGGNIVLGILKGIGDAVLGIGQWIYENIFQPFIDGFKSAFGIHSPSTVMAEQGNFIIEGLFNGISSLVGKITGIWNNMKSTAIEIFTNIKTSITNKVTEIKNGISQKFQEAYSNIRSIFSNIGNFFKGIWNNIKSTFSNLGTSIGNAISGAVKSGINGVISLVERTINSAIRMINNGIRMINLIPGVSVGTINTLSLPRLAKGNVAYNETLAVFGEYSGARSNPEITAPQSIMRETFEDVLSDFNSGNGQPLHVTIQYLGKKIFDDTIDYINSKTRRTGKNTIVTVGD